MAENDEMPLGLSLSMAMNEKARDNFSNLSKPQRDSIEEKARHIRTKADMEALIRYLAEGRFN